MSHISKHPAVSSVLIVLIIAASFFTGWQLSAQSISEEQRVEGVENTASPSDVELEDADFSSFWKAWNVINEKHVSPGTSTDSVSSEEKVWGAISGLARSLDDPYTVFLPPSDNEVFESNISGNFEGVGMEIGLRNGILTVISPLKGTPAQRAGIQAGDQILEIDGQSTENISTDEAVQLIRGEEGTDVTFLIYRSEGVSPGGTNPFLVTVTRDSIDIPTIETELRDDGVFVIELYNFSAQSPELFQEALEEFSQSGSDDLVFDLRGNPGGFLQASIEMASWFLPEGKVVVREDFGDKRDDVVYRSKGYDVFSDDLSMVILVDGGSASASEILAGALKEHGVATLVGTQTFGKGSVQELVEITPETALKLTVAEWLTPEGTSISKNGLSPDIEVEFTQEDFEAGLDPQLERAVEVLIGDEGRGSRLN